MHLSLEQYVTIGIGVVFIILMYISWRSLMKEVRYRDYGEPDVGLDVPSPVTHVSFDMSDFHERQERILEALSEYIHTLNRLAREVHDLRREINKN